MMDVERIKRINKLIEGISKGDQNAIMELYNEMAPSIRFIALKYIKNEFDADDLVQDFWADIYKIASKFHYVKNGFSYLCKVMTRMALNKYKKDKRVRTIEIEYVDYELLSTNSENEGNEEKIIVENALKQLNNEEKIILQLSFFEYKSVRQIGKELNMSKSKVNLIKNNALEKLKKIIDNK